MSGEVSINGSRSAAQEDFVLFGHSGERITVQAGSAAQLLVLSGEPIAEPIVQYGPFVMNTAREIEQAFADYSSGKFGHLDD
jgi:redox-sensitive bicupin YhaK (pirin superfamily)